MAKQTILIDINVVNKAAQPIQEVTKGLDRVAESQKKVINTQKQAKTQSGLNNAILLETGRLASDASYGFTAMANNLSQLTSLFGSFVKTNDGVIASFKQLGKSLLGTGGVLLAVQLLIGALQSATFRNFLSELGGVTRAMRLLKESTKEATDVFGKQIGFLRTMETLLNDTNVSQSQKEVILKRVKKEHEDLNPLLDEEGKLTEESTSALDKYIQVLERKAKSQALLNTIEKEYVKLTMLQQSAVGENVSVFEVFTDKMKAMLKGQNAFTQTTDLAVKGEENRREEMDKTEKTIEKLTEKLKELGVFMDEDTKNGVGKRFKNFKQQLLNLDKLEESYRKKSVRDDILTEEEKISNQDLFEKEDLKIRLDAFKKKQDLRLQEFKESGASASEIAKAEAEVRDAKIKAEQEAADVLVQIKAKTDTQFMMLETKRQEAEGKILEDLANKKIDLLRSELDYYVSDEYVEKKEAKLQQDIDDAEFNLEFNSKNIEERAANERALFDAQTALREEELANDTAFYEAKENVQMQYVGFSQQVGSLIGKLAGDNEKMQEVALLIEKGAATAKVIIETQKANAIASATITAYTATPMATSIPLIKAQMVRNKVGAALAIANIWASSTKSKSAAGGGGTGGGAGAGTVIQAPEFNVVGASPESQLASVVSESQAAPVKAFVVSKDITTQQELDRNTTNVASFG